MSNRRGEDSRPGGNATSARNTARDVPNAKFSEVPVGTRPPRGLRGNSLQPGQGAPEQLEPEDVELAVLRDAETQDGPNIRPMVPRPAPRKVLSSSQLLEPRAPSPTPVSVEVPRVRSIPPQTGDRASTPPSPSARSIQSGTLMSIGSVDPRAPTELSLPSPRPLSVSERAAYLGPEAVVDRTPRSGLPDVADSSRARDITERPGAPISEPAYSSQRSVMPSSSARPSREAESVAPHARHFAPRSFEPGAPPSVPASSARPGSLSPSSGRASTPHLAPQFQVHADLDAVRRDAPDDAFDLRSAATQREPLAGRRSQESADWTPHAPSSRGVPSTRSSSTAITMLVDQQGDSTLPVSERAAPPRAVPLSFVIGAALFALALAGLVAFVMRPTAHDAGQPSGGRASAAAPNTEPSLPHEPAPQPAAPPPASSSSASATTRGPGSAPMRTTKSSPHASAATTTPPSTSAAPTDSGSKSRSIY